MSELRLSITGAPCRLDECPPGLFIGVDGSMGFRTEYSLTNGGPEAFVLESGETWWGGTSDAKERARQIVTPARLEWGAPDAD